MVKQIRIHNRTVLYQNQCYKVVCYKGTTLKVIACLLDTALSLEDLKAIIMKLLCKDPEEGTGGPDSAPPNPRENQTAIGFLSNTAPEHVENHKATKPAFNNGPLSVSQRTAF